MFNFSIKNKITHKILLLGCTLGVITVNSASAQTVGYPYYYQQSSNQAYPSYPSYPAYPNTSYYNQGYYPNYQQNVVQEVTIEEEEGDSTSCYGYDMENSKVYEPVKTMYGNITYTDTATAQESYAYDFCNGKNGNGSGNGGGNGGYVMDLRPMINEANEQNENVPGYANLPFSDPYAYQQGQNYQTQGYQNPQQQQNYQTEGHQNPQQQQYYQALEAQNKQLREYYQRLIEERQAYVKNFQTQNAGANVGGGEEVVEEVEEIVEEINIDDIE